MGDNCSSEPPGHDGSLRAKEIQRRTQGQNGSRSQYILSGLILHEGPGVHGVFVNVVNR